MNGSDWVTWLVYENGNPTIRPLPEKDMRRQLYETMVDFATFENRVNIVTNYEQAEEELLPGERISRLAAGEDERYDQNPYWNYRRSQDYYD